MKVLQPTISQVEENREPPSKISLKLNINLDTFGLFLEPLPRSIFVSNLTHPFTCIEDRGPMQHGPEGRGAGPGGTIDARLSMALKLGHQH